VQNGKISVSFRCFAVLHWANGGYTTVKMTREAAYAVSSSIIPHIPANRKHPLEYIRSVIITDWACGT
jgi:hypothetical protein